MNNYFDVVARGQTYLNLIYLLLAFPLGLLYFIGIVVGFSLGIGLLIIWIGLVVLVAVFAGAWAATQVERYIAEALLGIRINRPVNTPANYTRLWERIRAHLVNPDTWKGIIFLFLKFPMGLFSFVVTIAGIAISGAMLSAPFTYKNWDFDYGDWHVDTTNEALLLFLLGIIIAPLVLHILNWIATGYGEVAKALLSQGTQTRKEVNRD
ncbi:MAG: hypothetical protein MAGBODY4_01537 [Candidatus Marinimicrobia bacterium]|nr:hypothetical protein [Candidatus Neomarinimicrobiota bacterium]